MDWLEKEIRLIEQMRKRHAVVCAWCGRATFGFGFVETSVGKIRVCLLCLTVPRNERFNRTERKDP